LIAFAGAKDRSLRTGLMGSPIGIRMQLPINRQKFPGLENLDALRPLQSANRNTVRSGVNLDSIENPILSIFSQLVIQRHFLRSMQICDGTIAFSLEQRDAFRGQFATEFGHFCALYLLLHRIQPLCN
jgi:hypothetical protein